MSDTQQLQDLSWQLAQQQSKADQTREELRKAILDALDNGVDVALIARQTGYSKSRIYKIRDCRS